MGDVIESLAGAVISMLIIYVLLWLGNMTGISDERNLWCRAKYTTVINYEGCKEKGATYQPKK